MLPEVGKPTEKQANAITEERVLEEGKESR